MNEAQRIYERELHKLQIVGDNMRQELIERSLSTVDAQLDAIAKECRRSLSEAVDYYRRFNAYIRQTE